MPEARKTLAAIFVLLAVMVESCAASPQNDRPFLIALLSDVHISSGGAVDVLQSLLGSNGKIDSVEYVESALQEIVSLHPDVAIACGDNVVEARRSSPGSVRKDFQLFNQSMQPIAGAGISFYPVLGNHDVVGVLNAKVNSSEEGYGRGMFLEVFHLARSYYSFDRSGYHFIVLDANSYELWNASSGISRYRIDEEQMSWLHKDLSAASRPVVLFIHEPTVDLINQEELMDVLQSNNALMIFSGHWHANDFMSNGAVPEQVTSALSGSWWMGSDLSGEPGGYRIIALNGSRVDSFYRYAGQAKQINIIEPQTEPVAGSQNIIAQIWSDQPVQAVRLILDGNFSLNMSLTRQGIWYEAEGTADLTGLAMGYHRAEVIAEDSSGTFSRNISLLVSSETVVPINEISSHTQTYLGRHLVISGYLEGYRDYSLIDEGMQPVLRDETGSIPLVLESCPTLPDNNSTKWLAEGFLQRYSISDKYQVLILRADGLCPLPVSSANAATFLSSR